MISGCQGMEWGKGLITQGQYERILGSEKNSSVWCCGGGYMTIKLSKPTELYTTKSEFYSANFKNQSGCWGTQMECSEK